MLEIRPVCENCGRDLPNNSDEAMICSFECTYCASCVTDVLQNVCPNCGGGFEKRPTRPTQCKTVNCVENFPLSGTKKYRPVNWEKFKLLKDHFLNIDPRNR